MKNNIWVLLGPELGHKHHMLQDIQKKFRNMYDLDQDFKTTARTDAGACIISFWCEVDSLAEIINILKTPSLFEPYRLIKIYQAESLSAAAAKTLSQVIVSTDEHTHIVLISHENKISSYLDIANKTQKKIFWALSSDDFFDYLISRARQMGIHIHPEAADLIVYLAGEHTLEIDMLLQQIALFLGEDKTTTVTKDNIEAWLVHYKKETVFSLFAAMAFRKYNEAFDTLFVLTRSGEKPVSLLPGLVYQLRMALQIARLQEQGTPYLRACEVLRIRHKGAQQQYKQFLDELQIKHLEYMIQLCTETDESLRRNSSQYFQTLLMSVFLYRIYMLHCHAKDTVFDECNNKGNFLFEW